MKSFKRNVKLDYIHTFLRNFNITHGIWLLYLVTKDFSLFEIGVFEGIFHLSSLTFEIPTGIVSDLYGRKLSRILSIFSYIIYIMIMLFSSNFWIVAVGFIICGLSYTFESGSGDALIYDSMVSSKNEDKFINFMGKKEVLYQMSTGIALLVGGYIAIQSYKTGFYFMMLVFVAALIPILMMKETRRNNSNNHNKISVLIYKQYKISSKIAFGDSKLFFLIIIGAMIAAPITSLFFYFQIHLENLDYSLGLIGILLGVHSFMGVLGGYVSVSLEKRFKEKLILFIIPIFIVFSFWVIQIDELIFLPFVLLGLLDSVFYVVLSDYMNKIIPSEHRATILSLNSFAFSLVMLILFPILGVIGDNFGLKFAFMILAIIVTGFYFLLLFVMKSNGIYKEKGLKN